MKDGVGLWIKERVGIVQGKICCFIELRIDADADADLHRDCDC
jgi:hypothetical protein